MLTPNHIGFRARREPYVVHGGGLPAEANASRRRGEGSKKNPQPSHGRLGILPACTLHSLVLEDFFVKNIQAGFLTLGSSYCLRLPTLILRQAQDEEQWLIASFVPEYSGGSVPDFLH